MISRIHSKLGTAGFIVAIVALVAALGGGAYAAQQGLNSKQKKEVKNIAKTEAKKVVPAAGPAGATGPAGAAGKDGTNGTNGTNGEDGTDGAPGANGKNVVLTAEPAGANCANGGTKVEVEGNAASKKYVCNGLSGFTDTLPAGKTETGVFASPFNISGTGRTEVNLLSFNIPLTATPTLNYIDKNGVAQIGSTDNCPGTPAEPKADSGNVCVYADTAMTLGTPEVASLGGGYPQGVPIQLIVPNFSAIGGTWAVTA